MTDTYTHGSCGSRWSGQRTSHCGNCHQTFTGLSAFDAHQRRDFGGLDCMPPEQCGLVARETAHGVVWGAEPMDDETRAKVFGRHAPVSTLEAAHDAMFDEGDADGLIVVGRGEAA